MTTEAGNQQTIPAELVNVPGLDAEIAKILGAPEGGEGRKPGDPAGDGTGRQPADQATGGEGRQPTGDKTPPADAGNAPPADAGAEGDKAPTRMEQLETELAAARAREADATSQAAWAKGAAGSQRMLGDYRSYLINQLQFSEEAADAVLKDTTRLDEYYRNQAWQRGEFKRAAFEVGRQNGLTVDQVEQLSNTETAAQFRELAAKFGGTQSETEKALTKQVATLSKELADFKKQQAGTQEFGGIGDAGVKTGATDGNYAEIMQKINAEGFDAVSQEQAEAALRWALS